MSWIKNLFTSKKKLVNQITVLESQLAECGNKLVEKQEHINTTNAYWKKKMREVKGTTPSKKKKSEL
jgi:peptidoglycan hydrolase CwlO-like protein